MLLVIAFDGKQWLAVLDVELCHYHARPKYIAEKRDVVVVGWKRIPQFFSCLCNVS